MLLERKFLMVSEKAFTVGYGISKEPMFAITERVLSTNKSAFSMLLHTHFLKASANVLQ